MSVLRLFALAKSSASRAIFRHVRFAALHEHGNVELFAQRFELVHGRRAIHIRRDEQRLATLLVEEPRELAGGSGFARAMQADHQDATRTCR